VAGVPALQALVALPLPPGWVGAVYDSVSRLAALGADGFVKLNACVCSTARQLVAAQYLCHSAAWPTAMTLWLEWVR
jgi:hypothetical protein